MAPSWFELVAWAALALGFASALVIAGDIVLLGNRQHMAIMNLAFPLTALYLGPLALWFYLTRGRRMSHKQMQAQPMMEPEARDSWWQVSLSDSHCGAGCALGDIAGEWIVWASAWTIGSTAELGPEYILDLPLAWVFGIAFQYFAIAPLRGQLGELAPLRDAIKSDTLSVLSFEVGLFGWMALVHYVIWQPPLPIDSSSYWFMMQIGMMLGFLTSWPVNRWLLRKGVKEPMFVGAVRPAAVRA
jgi:Domain of unknown function (DUF4396)